MDYPGGAPLEFSNPDLVLKNFLSFQNGLDTMLYAFDAIMLVLDHHGKILDFKTGNGHRFNPSNFTSPVLKFQDFVPREVGSKYENAVLEIRSGSRYVLFDYELRLLMADVWCESCTIPFTDDQNIMFVWNISKFKEPLPSTHLPDLDRTIEGWSSVLYLRDKETEEHTLRVTDMAIRLAQRMSISEQELIHIRHGAMLHDIGKVAIPDSILFKPGRLTDEEWDFMRRHPVIATELLEPILYFAPMTDIPRSHHEKWDGSGYPDGLAGEDIPLAARIFAFADVFDALTSDRPYRRAWSSESALQYIQNESGKHFDPSLTPEFIRLMEELPGALD